MYLIYIIFITLIYEFAWFENITIIIDNKEVKYDKPIRNSAGGDVTAIEQ